MKSVIIQVVDIDTGNNAIVEQGYTGKQVSMVMPNPLNFPEWAMTSKDLLASSQSPFKWSNVNSSRLIPASFEWVRVVQLEIELKLPVPPG
jgi:hypothetical protein